MTDDRRQTTDDGRQRTEGGGRLTVVKWSGRNKKVGRGVAGEQKS